jgi:hypothetical protein
LWQIPVKTCFSSLSIFEPNPVPSAKKKMHVPNPCPP